MPLRKIETIRKVQDLYTRLPPCAILTFCSKPSVGNEW